LRGTSFEVDSMGPLRESVEDSSSWRESGGDALTLAKRRGERDGAAAYRLFVATANRTLEAAIEYLAVVR